jgi:hypothetical protein
MLGEAGAPGRGIWPLTLYPGGGRGGTAEVVFQHLVAREPFTDRALRAEFLTRLNELEGVDIPEGKLELRLNFRLSVPEKDRNRELLAETQSWFRGRWEERGKVSTRAPLLVLVRSGAAPTQQRKRTVRAGQRSSGSSRGDRGPARHSSPPSDILAPPMPRSVASISSSSSAGPPRRQPGADCHQGGGSAG